MLEEFERGGVAIFSIVNGGAIEDFDAVGLADGTQPVFMKEADPSVSPNGKLFAMRKEKWLMMKSRKELCLSMLLTNGKVKGEPEGEV